MRFPNIVVLGLALLITHHLTAQNRHNDYGVFDITVDNQVWAPLDELGVGWIREQFRVGEADLDKAMILYDRIFEEGYGLLLTLHHRDVENIANQQSFVASTRGSYPPIDTVRYKAAVRNVVQRLVNAIQAHGRDPESALMIQFCNEVLPIDLVPDRPTRYWHGSSDQYLQTLELTYNAVKSIGVYDIPVVNAGIASTMLENLVNFDKGLVTDPDFDDIYGFNDRMLRQGRFDWVDVHLRHAKEDVKSKIDWAKERWNGPMIATEFAGPDVRTAVEFTEAVQAQELVERMEIASSAGVNRILWSHFMENPAVEDIFFQEGLIEYQTWRKKPAYFAYQQYLEDLNVVTSLDDELKERGLSLSNYPNPFSVSTTIELVLNRGWASEMQLRVFDFLGNTISEWEIKPSAAGRFTFDIDTAQLVGGLYFYRLSSEQFSVTKKMILER